MLPRSLFAVVCLLPLYVQAANRAIKEWTAMGDSYASGVGAGAQPADDTNRCFRFPNAYPAVMQSGPGSLQPNPLKWNNVACSGNTASQILDKEFLDKPEDDGKNGIRPAWGDKPEFVTLTMGGNDIGILNLITTCILSFKLWGLNCDQVIQEGMKIAQSDELKANFTAVIEKAYTKGRSTPVGVQFQVFVTGYAQFFNQVSTQCNKVTFKPSWNPLTAQYLTIERRTAMNTLALALNTAIKSAVDDFDPLYNVHYVDYDSQFEGYRFCDVDEPDPNNPSTWFFNWYTSEDPTTQAAFESMTAYKSSVANATTGLFQTDDDFINALGDALGDDPDALSTLSDSVRIFHPTSLGHQTIRNVMEAALQAAGVPEPESVSSSGTPAQGKTASSTGTLAPSKTVTSASASATCNCTEDGCSADSPACCANGTCPT